MQQHGRNTQNGMKHECNIDGGGSVTVLLISDVHAVIHSSSFPKASIVFCSALLAHSLTTTPHGGTQASLLHWRKTRQHKTQLSEVEVEGGARHT